MENKYFDQCKRIVNLCPHPVQVVDHITGAILLELPMPDRSLEIPRLAEHRQWIGSVCGAPVVEIVRGALINEPPAEFGTCYVVSKDCALAMWAEGRHDILCPGPSAKNVNHKAHPRACMTLSGLAPKVKAE